MKNKFKIAGAMTAVFLVLTGGALGCNQAEMDASGAPEGASETPAAEASHVHENADETCFICDASKRDPQRLWCNEHGRYEDRCFLCHPEIKDEDRLYCPEHYLYEDECFLCHPELREEASTPELDPPALADRPLVADVPDSSDALFCNEHQVYEQECGICHPELLASLEAGDGLKVRLPSVESARKAGVRVGHPNAVTTRTGATALGEVTYNKNAFAAITALASGVIVNVHVDVGDTVHRGDLLAEVSAPAVADAKSTLVKALVNLELKHQVHERERVLRERNVSSVQDLEEAHAAHAAARSELDRARQQLLNLGISEAEVQEVVETRSTSSTLPLRAPFDGTIVDREAVTGTAVEPGMPLFHLAELETMWLELSVPELEAGRVFSGVPVSAEFDALPGRSFEGELTWVSSSVDESTRTVKARATLPNPNSLLKSGLFGRVAISETQPSEGVSVPVDAIQEVDGRSIVFAKLEDGLYQTRIVTTGGRREGQQIILSGLSPTDEIALTESYVLKSELLKARLGAGCVHE